MGLTSPIVPADKIGAYYPETYYGKENVRFNPLIEALTRLFRQRRAAVLKSRVPKGAVLDVGCGRGFLLSYLQGLGYEAHGIEFSETAAWHARNVLGLDIETCDILTSKHEKGLYQAVIFWHSFEHMQKPAKTLARAHELLKPGGIVAIALPNSESLQARLFGRHWFHLDIPRHYTHFTTTSLVTLLKSKGFRIVQTDHFSFEQNPYGWLQSFYDALGFKRNLLYTLLKDKTARTDELRTHPLQVVVIILLLPLFTTLSLVLTVIETILRRGGSIEVYAVKE